MPAIRTFASPSRTMQAAEAPRMRFRASSAARSRRLRSFTDRRSTLDVAQIALVEAVHPCILGREHPVVEGSRGHTALHPLAHLVVLLEHPLVELHHR